MNRNRLCPILCIGIDNTPTNIEIINGRFTPHHDRGELIFKTIKKFDDNTMEQLLKETKRLGKSIFAVYQGDFFRLDKLISPAKIDMIFHSRVIHHLGMDDRYLLEEMCRKLSFVTVELEDIYSRLMPLLAALMTWGVDRYNLSLMNGAVISCIRDPGESHLHGYVKKVLPNSYVKLILGEDSHFHNKYPVSVKESISEEFTWYE